MPQTRNFTARRRPAARCIFKAANETALPRLLELCRTWLPDGRLQGSEFVARNPTRDDRRPGSFSINTRSGVWADFATDDRGGDPISLYAYLNGLSQIEAARELAAELGVVK